MPVAAPLLHLFLLTAPVSLDYRPAVAEAAPAPYVPAPSAPSARPRHSWYGWQLLLADALFVGVTVAASDHSLALSALGLGGLALGTPLLHLANGNSKAVPLSMIVRGAAAALLFAAITDYRGSQGTYGVDEDIDGQLQAIVMAAVAIVAGGLFVILDDSLRARKLRYPPGAAPVEGGAAPAASRAGPVVVPTVFLRRQGGGLGLVAAF